MSSLFNKSNKLDSNIKIHSKRYSISSPKMRDLSFHPSFERRNVNFLDIKSHHDYSTEGNTPNQSNKKLLFISRKKLKPIKHKFNDGVRRDFFGNRILKGGNQKLTFIDEVSHNNLVEVTLIETNNCSFKYNENENKEKDTALCSCDIF